MREGASSMRITALETIRANFHDNLIWLHIETDDGLIGLGETFYVPSAVEAYLHDNVAPLLLGGDASRIGAWNARLIRQPVGYASSGWKCARPRQSISRSGT
jgi:galactonate dehydratase